MKTKEVIIGFIKKYKIETIAVFAVSFVIAYLFELRIAKIENLCYEALSILLFLILGSFLIDKIFIIYDEEIKKKIVERYSISDSKKEKTIFNIVKSVAYLIVTICGYIIYRLSIYLMTKHEVIKQSNYSSYAHKSIIIMKNYSLIIVCALLVVFVFYFVMKEKKIDIKNFSLKVFINFLFVFLVECVVLIGILVLYLICEALLGTISYSIISRINTFIISVVSLMGFFVGLESVKGENSLFSKILVRYIMQTMVFIGFIIFYVYLIKIIIKTELPSNQVFSVCTTLFSIGLFTSLMSLAIDEESVYSKAIKYLPIAFIPALIMQIISISLRVNQHGMTTNRYFGVMIIIFEIVYLVFYILGELLKNEKVKLKNILIISNIFILIMFFIPKVNSYEFPEIYNKLFKKSQKTETVVSNNKYENKYVIRSMDFDDIEADIRGYDKLKTFNIYVEYDKNKKKYISIKEKGEYDNKTIDILNIINNLENNIKSIDGNNYPPEDVFKNVGYEIVTGNNKMIINHIWMEYNKEIEKIDHLELQGYIVTKDNK